MQENDQEGIATRLNNDLPTRSDCLGYRAYARAIASLVRKHSDTPLTIGIHGAWGSGKTSLMRMVEWEINPCIALSIASESEDYELVEDVKRDLEQLIPEAADVDDAIALFKKLRESNRRKGAVKKGIGNLIGTETRQETKRRLYSRIARPGEPVVDTMWFNAWEHDVGGAIWGALRKALSDHLNSSPRYFAADMGELGRFASKGADLVANIATGIATQGAVGDAGIGELLGLREDLVSYKKEFQRAVEKIVTEAGGSGDHENIIMIFIDDLDRCSPATVINLLEQLKIFFDTKGCIFVLAAAEEVIASGIEAKGQELGYSHYFAGKGEQYLEKIIQFPFHLPPLTADHLRRLLSEQGIDASEQTKTLLVPLLGYVTPLPRRLKRLVNALIFTTQYAQALQSELDQEIDFSLLVKLLLVSFEWPQMHRGLSRFGKRFYQELYQFIDNPYEVMKGLPETASLDASMLLKLSEDSFPSVSKEAYVQDDEFRALIWETALDRRARSFIKNVPLDPEKLDVYLNLTRFLVNPEPGNDSEKIANGATI